MAIGLMSCSPGRGCTAEIGSHGLRLVLGWGVSPQRIYQTNTNSRGTVTVQPCQMVSGCPRSHEHSVPSGPMGTPTSEPQVPRSSFRRSDSPSREPRNLVSIDGAASHTVRGDPPSRCLPPVSRRRHPCFAPSGSRADSPTRWGPPTQGSDPIEERRGIIDASVRRIDRDGAIPQVCRRSIVRVAGDR
jgi:hypothetical protein